MKLFLIGFAVIAAVAADVSHLSSEYLPPALEEVQTVVQPSNEYLAPVESIAEQGSLADDGYRYKTHKRVVLRRHRRDVSHLPSNEYLPPQAAPSNEYLPPQQVAAPINYAPAPVEAVQTIEEPVPAHELADDGYRYKTHRRVVLRRHRRDVNELSNEYLPPVAAPSNEYLAPVESVAEQGSLADDGYRYKTHRRVVLRRHRRDVNELSNEYLPPVAAPSNEYLAPIESVAEQGSLADDGYRYKTNKRVVVRRHRRDVNELSNEYLPPVAAPSNEYLAPIESVAEQGSLADDGYRYKTNKRVVVRRHRRDVNELSNEYLPPVAAPSNEYLAPIESVAEQGSLADDGYRYKTHKRVVLRRHRRDVSHLPSNEYLPPQAAPSNEYLPPQQVAAPIQVAAPAPVYVSAPAPAPAPIQVAAPAPIQVSAPVVEAEPAHELADDGYRYKTHRRVVLRRHRRDVSHLISNEYLPPQAAPSNEYLPPQQVAAPIQVAAPAPVYVSAPAPAPAPIQVAAPAPIQVAAPAPIQVSAPVVEAEPAHELAADGYRYKTHRRVVYRRH